MRSYITAVLMYIWLNGETKFYLANNLTGGSHNYFIRRSLLQRFTTKTKLGFVPSEFGSFNSLPTFKRT